MPLFEYTALDSKGRKKNGFVDAVTIQSAREKLRADGFFIVNLTSAAVAARGRERVSFPVFVRFSRSDLASMTRQLSTLLRAGLPLVQALEALVEQMEKPAVRKTLSGVRNLINEGASFHEALAQYPGVFPPMYIQMCRAGEAGGFLDEIMRRLAGTLEKEVQIRGRIAAALVYPVVMTVIGGGLLLFLLAFVVPQVISIFSDLGEKLPLPTRILLFLSGVVSKYWFLMILAAGGLIVLYVFLNRSRKFGRTLDAWKLKIPIFGGLSLKVATVRLSHILGTLLASGVPLIRALEVVGDVLGNRVLSEAVQQAGVSVSRGGSLADAFRASGVFPPILPRVVAVGEQSGDLSGMLTGIADTYEEEVGRTIQAMTAALEPILIVAMAVMVFFVVVSILLPIFELNQLVRSG